ncbi:MAG: AAA family ATPase [Planctomycetota bacterium]|jgi:chromosome partitioning protein
MRVIAIVNQKGGCGKTTTAINLAATYAQRGQSTLIVDMDPQAHCAAGLGVPEDRAEMTVADALVANHDEGFDPESLVWEVSRHLYLAPSSMRLAALEAPGGGLHEHQNKDRRLASLLNVLRDRFDTCLIDCPPTIGLLTFNALRAAREALIPVETGFFAMKGAHKQWATIQRTIQHIGRPIACHLLPTMHRDARLSEEILASLRRDFAGQIVPTVIREHDALREAASLGQPVVEYAPKSEARADFEALADWLDDHRPATSTEIEVLPQTVRGAPIYGRPPGAAAPPRDGSRAAELVQRVRELSGSMNVTTVPATAPSEAGGTTPAHVCGALPLEPLASERVPVVPVTSRLPDHAPGPVSVETPVSSETAVPSMTPAAALDSGGAMADPAIVDVPAPQPSAREVIPSKGLPASLRPATAPMRGDAHVAARTPEPPPPAVPAAPPIAEVPRDVAAGPKPDVRHLYGVRATSHGMLFVQPGGSGRSLTVAGDFNRWSVVAHAFTYNEQLDVYQVIIPVEPGRHQYRLVIDGRWQADPYNPDEVHNSYGELNSVFTVEPERGNEPNS